MRFHIYLLAICPWFSVHCFGQKPVLTEADFNSWPHLDLSTVSNDGKYVVYHISTEDGRVDTLYIQDLATGVQKKVANAIYEVFTADSHTLLYLKGDSLGILDLASQTDSFLLGIQSFKVPAQGALPVVAYKTKGDRLEVWNRKSGQRKEFDKVQDYEFSKSGRTLLNFQRTSESGHAVSTVNWVDLKNGKTVEVWHGEPILRYTMDSSESKLAFITGKDAGDIECKIWEFDTHGGTGARPVLNESNPSPEVGYSVTSSQLEYSPDGKRLFFRVVRLTDTIHPKAGAVSVDVWNYKDEWLQCDQLNEVMSGVHQTYLSVVDLLSRLAKRLEGDQDGQRGEHLDEGKNDDFALIISRTNFNEGYRNPLERPDIYLVDTRTGERRCIARQVQFGDADFSRGGNYVTWYDPIRETFSFYNIEKRTTRLVDAKIFPKAGLFGCEAWLEGDKGLLMNDRYDIWQVDPEGKRAPANITHGYGRRHQLYLRMAYLKGAKDYAHADEVKERGPVILSAFSEENKSNGFYFIKLGSPKDPEKLNMEPDAMYFSGSVPGVDMGGFLLKARDTNTFVLTSERANKFPNLVVTHDFRIFTPLTFLAPEEKVNWLTSELIRWRTFDGQTGQGILYKPQDFDPGNKYPVIFYVYERFSSRLNFYLYPAASGGSINIPWFVSHGYLVFCPDIKYPLGDPGKGVYNYVASAAVMMKGRSWVDGRRMAIQGHSFGGYEVNYLITCTRLFVAAYEGAGATDLVSYSGEVDFSATSNQTFVEVGQNRMKVCFWQNKESYIRNSAVFGADKIAAPLLMMHDKLDRSVTWSQALELFTALRRLNKPCYWLQYDHGGHGLGGADALDFNRRLTQFFDHYLKGAPEPRWMSEGLPARLKGIDTGLELVGMKK